MFHSKVDYVKCPICDNLIEINGCGPLNLPLVTKVLDFVFPYAQKHFWNVGKAHDIRYHEGQRDSSHTREWWKLRADRLFLRDCLLEANNKTKHNLIQRKVLRRQALAYYTAVRVAGGKSFGNDGCKEATI